MMSLPVHNPLPLKVLQATAQLCGVENRSVLFKAGVAQVVDVELQVSSIHKGQHEAQGVFGFVSVAQAHLEAAASQRQNTEACPLCASGSCPPQELLEPFPVEDPGAVLC